MKKILLGATAVMLVLTVLSGCNKQQAEPTTTAEPSVSATESTATTSAEKTSTTSTVPTTTETEGAASSDSVEAVYAQQIERYYTSISEKWDENTYFDNEMSSLAAYYYEGNSLDNIGFTFMDLDGDDIQELIIGAIKNSEQDPLVFEIWTLKNDEPVMLAQSGSHNRYYMQYAEEEDMWSVANEAENGAANHAVYYLYLAEGEFEVIQGIVFDAAANEKEPWFMAYDLDWNTSNDTPINEDTAEAVIETQRNIYTAIEYIPYSLYK